MRPKCLVLRAAGTNCDLETAEAIKIAGGDPEILHINVLIKGEKKLDDYQMLVIPGGFSYADSISAGKILSNILKNNLKHQLKKFIDEGKPVLGVCNGFQALIKSGFLPFSNEVDQSASLIINKNGLFIDTWVYLKINPKSICLLTKNSPNVIYLPINHGEGRFVCNKKELEKIFESNQVVYLYSSINGIVDEVYNPNGSVMNIAAITNEYGNVFGIMPHPEKFVSKYQHPNWTRFPNLKEEGDGLFIYSNAVKLAKKFC